MREVKRIHRIQSKINKIWSSYPDLRLGQLYYNAITMYTGKNNVDLHCIEDDILEKALDHNIKVMGLE